MFKLGVRSRILVPCAVVALLAGGGAASHAAGATVCRASLLTSFQPSLSGTTEINGDLRIAGSLSDCAPGASSASVSAGNVWTDPATGYKWQEPVGRISGTCVNNSSTAVAISRWSDGAISITAYSSESATYGIVASGMNMASTTLMAVNKQAGQADTLTVTATRDVGARMTGLLFADDPSDPIGSAQAAFDACAGGGLDSAPLNGIETFAG